MSPGPISKHKPSEHSPPPSCVPEPTWPEVVLNLISRNPGLLAPVSEAKLDVMGLQTLILLFRHTVSLRERFIKFASEKVGTSQD